MDITAKIQQGNDFLLKLHPRMIDGTVVLPSAITDVEVKIGDSVYEHGVDEEFITVQVPAGQPLGKYDVTITGKIGDRKIRDCRKELFERVPDGCGIPYAVYVTDFYIIGSTDEELELMKRNADKARREFIAAKEEADAAKAEWMQKIAEVDHIAQQGDDPNASMSSVQHKIDNMTDFVTLEEINEMCDGILIPYNN